ncbi:Rpn family recombination-promoting nuclease/putative transposase [Kerstersia sp.]|uniref:Rpn family recombination-promoting nuclease/putative transposase n=1 Tax=Kerstersia sp. TaxID=1930783 RepID=UPI003F8FBA61
MHHSDPHYRRLFGHPAVMRALLEGFMPAQVLALLDMDSLQIVPAEHLADPSRQRRGDLVWRVRGKEDVKAGEAGAEVFLVFLLEHQSSADRVMALRMASYAGLTYQTLLGHKLLSPRQPLPLMLPLVLYSGIRQWRYGTSMDELLGPVPALLRPYQLQHSYFLVDMGQLVAQNALPEDNLASLIFMLEHNQGVEQAAALMQSLMRRARQDTELMRILGAWVRHVILPRALPAHIPLPDTEALPELTTMTIAHSRDWTLRPRMEGRLEGRQEGQLELLSCLLARKFGELPAASLRRLSEASQDELKRWSLNVLEAQTLEQVFLTV